VAEPVSSAPEPSAAPLKVPAARADVAREVALLDAARVALLQGNARRALDALAGLERMPVRALLPEATVLRVRALLALDDLKTARQVAARFVATAPGSPQAPVLRGLFAEPLETKMNDSASRNHKTAIRTDAGEL
jgi:outer membrane protein assembly factor BamD (BamD/ComL family)